ncbi:aspartate carbamoyltransferase catalytic subunit [Candidatus Oleimmundimicrobium sp.]|uniref:aspartate carbamoyltransferase catalytic subunit n=1 Tax=Candidatus Oleimmundimicrobium sp. TaxID=3060597 RepID=UPI002726ED2F|nr:aspartate carbamoyltransferase catalytic subunit [Candidatus Oleimmundimicrobium sp.]MDO8885417.1 aspartate carbamoyltransferase catalytic subunit [Candidatus Oleimmundimicrobium sp.]
MAFEKKDLLGIKGLKKEEIQCILELGESFKEILARDIKKVPTLRGKTVVNLFVEPSTRTRISFELAAKRLSADVVNISAKNSSLTKGESLRDTAKTIEALGADAVIIRHPSAGAPHFFAKNINANVINAGDGAHEHPTQALLDLYTIKEKLGRINGLHVGIVGDIAHSRVARSNTLALTKMGAKVTLVGPPTLIPMEAEAMGAKVEYDFDKVIGKFDIIYMLRIQLERQTESLFPSIREYTNLYSLNFNRFKKAKKNVLIMHPGPMNRGIEISYEVADMPQAVITDQVVNGVAVRMAVLYVLLGGGEFEKITN